MAGRPMDRIRAEIEAIEAARARAIVAADVAALDALTDASYVHIDADGQRRDKKEFLEIVAARTGRFTRYDVTGNVILASDDLAVVHGCFDNEHVATDGRIRTKSARHVRLYRLGPAGWLNILHQATLSPSSDARPATHS